MLVPLNLLRCDRSRPSTVGVQKNCGILARNLYTVHAFRYYAIFNGETSVIAFAGFRAFKTAESVFPGLADPSISRHFPQSQKGCVLARSNDPEQNLEMDMSWTRMSNRGQGRPHTRLRFESLEERSLLAVAAFQINLFEDVGGAPGELIADNTIEPGDTFFVEITAREYNPYASGLGGIALDIAWDPNSLEEIDNALPETITENLPLYNGGDLDNEAGTITNLRGACFPAFDVGRSIGNLMFEQFAVLHFRALESAEDSSITMEQGAANITTVPASNLSPAHIDFETQTIHIVSQSLLSSAEQVLPDDSELITPTPVIPTSFGPDQVTQSDDNLKSSSVPQPVLAAATTDEGPLVRLALNVYEDSGGTPGKAITGGEVEIGESFYVQIAAEDLRDAPLGIGGLSVDVSWDPDVFREIDLPFEPASLVTEDLPLYQSGTLDQDAGQIDDLGGVSLRSMAKGQPIGAGGSEQFALLHFTAVGVADSSIISLAIGSSGVGVVEGTVDSPDDVLIQSTSISVVKLVAPPANQGNRHVWSRSGKRSVRHAVGRNGQPTRSAIVAGHGAIR